jgi:hypothetical protein
VIVDDVTKLPSAEKRTRDERQRNREEREIRGKKNKRRREKGKETVDQSSLFSIESG